jgi:membrane associated rhomboid family serine protease
MKVNCCHRHKATTLLTALIVVLSVWGFYDPVGWVLRFGLVPATVLEKYGITLVSCIFFHSNWLHLLGCLVFFGWFGWRVESVLGAKRFLLLFLVSGLMGSISHTLFNLHSNSLGIGASGAIAGLIVFYTLHAPKKAWLGFIAALLVQIIGAWMHHRGLVQASLYAHLGGAFSGIVFWRLWK